MLKTDAISLSEEIEAAEALRKPIIDAAQVMIDEYRGAASEPIPENVYFEWFTHVLPKVIYDNPRVDVRFNRSGIPPVMAESMAVALNWWSESVSLWRVLEDIFYDAAFSYGVAMVYFEPYPGFEGSLSTDEMIPFRPTVRRIAPQRWFCDAHADSIRDARLMGHTWKADKSDLMEDERFDREALQDIPTESELRGFNEKHKPKSGNRDEIYIHEVWVPEHRITDDEDAHGTIFTVAQSQRSNGDKTDPKWIREPRPWYGPPSGPYVMFGYNRIPGCPYPLSTLLATRDQIKEMNAHLRAAARSAANTKRFVAYDPGEGDMAGEAVKSAKDGSVIGVPGLGKHVQEMQVGGVTKEQYIYNDSLRDRVERSIGLSDNSRGSIDSDASATAIADAAGERDNRISGLKRSFAMSTTNVLSNAAYYFFTQESAVFSLPATVATKLMESIGLVEDAESTVVVFGGGPSREPVTQTVENGRDVLILSANSRGVRFDDLQIDIDPHSMERANEALLQNRNMEIAKMALQIAPAGLQYPFLKIEGILNMLGDSMNMKNIASRLIDMNQLKQFVEQQQQQQQMMMQQGAAAPA